MTRHDSGLDPAVEPLLERGRIVPPVPDLVRARALARARAAVSAAMQPPLEAAPTRWRRVLPIALAASIALTVGAAGAVAALYARALPPPRLASEPSPAVAPPVRSFTPAPAPSVPLDSFSASTGKPRHAARLAMPRESYAAELELLARAQAAYAGRDFTGALALVAEHSRRFPSGRLAEEREALRVRSLARSGSGDEAARAAAAFAVHFPRSVLLPRLTQELR